MARPPATPATRSWTVGRPVAFAFQTELVACPMGCCGRATHVPSERSNQQNTSCAVPPNYKRRNDLRQSTWVVGETLETASHLH
jgi:hypothetical protein